MYIGFLRVWLAVAAAVLIGAAVAASPGCGLNEGIIENCTHPVPGGNPCNGQLDPCCAVCPCPGVCVEDPCPDAGSDAAKDADDEQAMNDAEAGPICAGACLALPPAGWSSPVLVWQGAPSAAPLACPDEAPFVELEGNMGLVVPPASCGACSCGPSTGTCVLPTTITAAASAACPTPPGAISVPFDPPPSWDGGCTAPPPIDAGTQCGGGACVQSLTADPLTIIGESCAPATATPPSPTPPLTWTTSVLACAGDLDLEACGDPTQVCLSPAAPPPSYQRCVYQPGDQDCPAAFPLPQPQVYTGAIDMRSCTACTCGAPSGSECDATLSVFQDQACSTPLPLSDGISSHGPACFDVMPPGPAVGSMGVDDVVYKPGVCAPGGGQPTGTATPTGLVTLCCAP